MYIEKRIPAAEKGREESRIRLIIIHPMYVRRCLQVIIACFTAGVKGKQVTARRYVVISV